MVAMKAVELFERGKWRGRPYTDADLNDICRNFDEHQLPGPNRKMRVAITKGHRKEDLDDPALPKFGTVSRVYREGGKILYDAENVDPVLAQEIKDGKFEEVSIEVYDQAPEGFPGATGKMLRRVAILGGNVPEIKGLNPHGLARTLCYDERRPRIPITRILSRRGSCEAFTESVPVNQSIDGPISKPEADFAAFAESFVSPLASLDLTAAEMVNAWRGASAADRRELEREFGYKKDDRKNDRPNIRSETEFVSFAESKADFMQKTGTTPAELLNAWRGADYRDREELERMIAAAE